MSPVDVIATDAAEWTRFRARLEDLGVAGDEVSALLAADLHPRLGLSRDPGWPASPTGVGGDLGGDVDARRVIVAWLCVMLDDPRAIHDNAIDRQAVRDAFALSLVYNVVGVAELTGHTTAQVVEHVLREARIGYWRFESLAASVTAIDVATIVAITGALGIMHDEAGWRVESPDRLRGRIERSCSLSDIESQAATLGAEGLRSLLARARRSEGGVGSDEVDPKDFDKHMKRGYWRQNKQQFEVDAYVPPTERDLYRPLYEALYAKTSGAFTLKLVEIAEIQRRATRRAMYGEDLAPSLATKAFWANGSAYKRGQVRAWQAAGLRVVGKHFEFDASGQVDLERSQVDFREMMPGRHNWLRWKEDPTGWRPRTDFWEIKSSGKSPFFLDDRMDSGLFRIHGRAMAEAPARDQPDS